MQHKIITTRKQCAGCGEDIVAREQYISAETQFFHPRCVRCAMCKESVSLTSLVFTAEGLLAHRECLAKPCSECGKPVMPDDFALQTGNHTLAHSGCLLCGVCMKPLGKGQSSSLSDGRFFHARCLVCSICKEVLQLPKLQQHPFWKQDFLCDTCRTSCPACFCCERKHALSKMSPYPGGFHLCRRCSCMGLVEDPTHGGQVLIELLNFLDSQLDLQFTPSILKNQQRSFEIEAPLPKPKKRISGNTPLSSFKPPRSHDIPIPKSPTLRPGRRLKAPNTQIEARVRSAAPPIQREKAAAFLRAPNHQPAPDKKKTLQRPHSAVRSNGKQVRPASQYSQVLDAIPVCLVTFDELNITSQEQPYQKTKTYDIEGLTRSVTLTTAPQRWLPEKEDKAQLSHLYGRCDCRTTEIVTVESNANRYSPKHQTSSGAKDVENTEHSEIVRQVQGIYLLSGLPEAVHTAHLAHELMHAWIFLSGFPILDPMWEEGLCNLIAAKYLEYTAAELKKKQIRRPLPLAQAKEELVRFQLWKMERNPDPAYGDGYKMVRKIVAEKGLKKVLDTLSE